MGQTVSHAVVLPKIKTADDYNADILAYVKRCPALLDLFQTFINKHCDTTDPGFYVSVDCIQSAWVSYVCNSGLRNTNFRNDTYIEASVYLDALGYIREGNGRYPVYVGIKLVKWPYKEIGNTAAKDVDS